MKAFQTLLLCMASLCLSAWAEVTAVADPKSDVPADKTIVWSPLFQATWDELNQHMGGKPKKLASENALMTRLDHFTWNAKSVLPEGRWKTWAGPATLDFLDKVNQQAAAMTGEAETVIVPAETNPMGYDYQQGHDPKRRRYFWATNDPDPQPSPHETDVQSLLQGKITLTALSANLNCPGATEQLTQGLRSTV